VLDGRVVTAAAAAPAAGSRLQRRVLLALLALALLGYVIDLGGASIWDANEAFYVETPREMLESGDYVNPQFNYEPRVNKPVLSYWIVAALYQVFGVSVAVQRAAITLGALVMIGAALLLARAASAHAAAPLLAALGLAANPRFFMFARRILIDVALAAMMTMILLFFALAERYPARRRTFLAAMYVCVGLGVLAKGPVAAVLPALVFLIYLLVHGELARVREMMIPAGTAIALAIVAPWYVVLYLEGGWAPIVTFFVGENFDRYTSLVGPQSRGAFFYLPVVFTDSLPWSLCLPAAVAAWLRDRRQHRMGPDMRVRTLLLLWIAVIVGFFSFSQTKQDLYIFPIVAAVAALGADVIARALFGPGRDGARWLLGTLIAAALLFIAFGSLALYLFGTGATVYAVDGAGAVGLVTLAGGMAIAVFAWRHRAFPAVVALLAVCIAFNWILVLQVLPSFERYKPALPLSRSIQRHARPGDQIAHFDVAMPSMVFYLQRHIDMIFDRARFLETMRSGRTVLAVVPENRYREMEGELAGSTCVLDRHATADMKLREILSRRPPPAVLLVSTRCTP
jgi:4-amino-4-deoxy-L-arabinose transferase-like glycosyltransferase